MATKFKYSLESLEWDEQHLRNKEGVYCYCGLDYSDGDSIVCNGGTEQYERDTLSWVQVIYLVLFHLVKTEPDKKYFRWRENICATISDNWESLMPGKAKTATWHNTVAGCLSTHHSMFRSGFDDTQQTGNWTLQDTVPPAQAKFKAAVKSREPRTAKTKAKSEAKRPRKKVEVAAGSEAEKEILEVLNERSGEGKTAARPRVSFSDDESEGEQQGARRRAKRRRVESKTLENDVDLLQSFEIFTRLEKERLGEKADGVSGLDDLSDLESLSSLSSLSSDLELELEDDTAKDDLASDALLTKAAENRPANPAEADTAHADSISPRPGSPKQAESIDRHSGSASSDSGSSHDGAEDRSDAKAAADDRVTNDHASRGTGTGTGSSSRSSETARGLSSTSADSLTRGVESPTTALLDKDAAASESPQEPPVWTRMDGIEARPLFDEEDPTSGPSLQMMSEQSQWEVCAKIGSSRVPLTSAARRLRRRLELRRFKRMLGLPLLDVDRRVRECMSRQQIPWAERPIDRQALELAGGGEYEPDATESGAAAPDGSVAGQGANGGGRSN
ncbi:hypothetical protein LPJ56_002000, partial [Coemansia sp. RSA 2599]